MTLNSHNDWDPLEEIIVGSAINARVPTVDPSTMSFMFANCDEAQIKAIEGPYPSWVIEEANADLEALCDVIRDFGATVRRPQVQDTATTFATPEWESTGWESWCPRDLLLVLGDLMIETPVCMRARYFETRIYRPILLDYMRRGAKWIAAPKPILPDDTYDFSDLSKPTLRNLEIIFDAPNVLRVGRDLLFQISNSGNHMGLEWLRALVGDKYRIHACEHVYSFAHLDSTILPLRPGLVLLNSARVNDDNCPEIFQKWDKIYFEDVIPQTLVEGFPPVASKFIGLNILSLDPQTVVVEESQVLLMRALESHGLTCVPVRFRHAATLSGGLHCVTLDTIRRGSLEEYC